MAKSSGANQKSVVGVYQSTAPSNLVPTALAKEVINGSGNSEVKEFELDSDYDTIMSNNDCIYTNSLGEGQVNVCGENGDIEIGDLIVSSSTAGKGMKQDDDIVRSCTVGKAREAVTFASASTVKQIACIYLCG